MSKTRELTPAWKTVEAFVYTLTAVVGVFLNIVIIAAIQYLNRPYICTKVTLHLTVAHIIGCIFVIMLRGIGDSSLLNTQVCEVVITMQSFWTVSVMSFTIFLVLECLLSVRYQIKRFHQETRRVVFDDEGTEEEEQMLCMSLTFTIFLVWIGSAIIALFTLLSISTNDNKHLCLLYQHTRKELSRYYFAFIVVLPMLLIFIAYIYYKRISNNHKRTIGTYDNEIRAKRRLIQRNMHYTKSAFYTSHSLLLTWTPHVLYMFCLIDWFVTNINFYETTYHVLKFIEWIHFSLCLLQPIVILKTNYQIKLKVKAKSWQLWHKICGKPKPSSQQSQIKIVNNSMSELSHENNKETIVDIHSVPNLKLHENDFTRRTIETSEIDVHQDPSMISSYV